ncbi:MAG TPA: macro domain-containing protein [Candidatus Eisenbacteria bacterium]|nr:macro domain-containing protein [Candidatus Eisenbacteria bacterium]
MTAGSWVEVADGRVMEVAQGDITRIAADAIVNAANSALAVGGGVDGAIHRTGGPGILHDLEERYGTDRYLPTGQAVVTVAGILPARWVIHAVGPVWDGGDWGESELLESAYRSAMARADEVGARSIALPAISCGVYGYPIEAAAAVALTAVGVALQASASVTRATFVLYSFDTFEVFRNAMARLRSGESPSSDG